MTITSESRLTTAPKFLRRKLAADYITSQWGIPCAQQTLAKYAVIGGGPLFHLAGRFPLYRTDHLDAWALARIGKPVSSTSEITSENSVEETPS